MLFFMRTVDIIFFSAIGFSVAFVALWLIISLIISHSRNKKYAQKEALKDKVFAENKPQQAVEEPKEDTQEVVTPLSNNEENQSEVAEENNEEAKEESSNETTEAAQEEQNEESAENVEEKAEESTDNVEEAPVQEETEPEQAQEESSEDTQEEASNEEQPEEQPQETPSDEQSEEKAEESQPEEIVEEKEETPAEEQTEPVVEEKEEEEKPVQEEKAEDVETTEEAPGVEETSVEEPQQEEETTEEAPVQEEAEPVVEEEVTEPEEAQEESNEELEAETEDAAEDEEAEEEIEELEAEEDEPKAKPVKKAATKKTAIVPVKKGRTYNGKYEVYQTADGYAYQLKASNGEILVTSETYASKDGVLKAIDAVKKNLETGTVKIFPDKRGKYQFKLISKNYRTLAISANYNVEKSAIRASESFKKFALKADIVDIELPDNDAAISTPIEITAKPDDKQGGKFVYEEFNGEFGWELRASNGQILCQMDGYTSKKGCMNSIDKFKENVASGTFKCVQDKAGRYQFKLYSQAGRICAVGESYSTKQSAEGAANSVVSFSNAPVVEEKPKKK